MKKHDKVISLIKVIRHSFHDSLIVYRWGGCYGLYQILKHIFPEAEAHFQDDDYDHIITKIGGRFYEIKGELCITNKKQATKLSKEDHKHWEEVAYGQRLEDMLFKYQKEIKKQQ